MFEIMMAAGEGAHGRRGEGAYGRRRDELPPWHNRKTPLQKVRPPSQYRPAVVLESRHKYRRQFNPYSPTAANMRSSASMPQLAARGMNVTSLQADPPRSPPRDSGPWLPAAVNQRHPGINQVKSTPFLAAVEERKIVRRRESAKMVWVNAGVAAASNKVGATYNPTSPGADLARGRALMGGPSRRSRVDLSNFDLRGVVSSPLPPAFATYLP